jgi:hypothetical protein
MTDTTNTAGPAEIKVRRHTMRRGTARAGWTYEYVTPVDITWDNGDGTSRPGPRAGEWATTNNGSIAAVRAILRDQFPGARITETWKASARP